MKDVRIDQYISRSAEFARPVLNHLRKLIHKYCPDVEETMKWSFPHFMYAGEILCSMASFKAHCSFGFWKASLIDELKGIDKEAMGHFGRIESIKDLPSEKSFAAMIKKAMKLNEEGIKVQKKKPAPANRTIVIPDYFDTALRKNKKAFKNFEAFSYSHKKEYIEWITDAKQDATRERRMNTALEWIGEGKGKNWKYESVKS
jgi:uncharacterized protein YdeI (YjbR/CyaY-like superfamily)